MNKWMNKMKAVNLINTLNALKSLKALKIISILKILISFLIGFSMILSHSAVAAENRSKSARRPVRNVYTGAISRVPVHERVVHSPMAGRARPSKLSQKPSAKKSLKPTFFLNGVPCARALDGWKITSAGGLAYENKNDQRFWVKVSGVLRYDQTFFSGTFRDRRRDFPNSGFIRIVETYVDSGLGQDWLSTFGLTWTGERVFFTDTWVGYTGFAENNEVNIGRISGNWFGLEGSSGSTWNPFMERSLQNSAFYPGDGLGVLTDFWWPHGQITLMVNQPDHGSRIFDGGDTGGHTFHSDRWRGLVRATYAPVVCEGKVWHFGLSFAHRRNDVTISGLPLREENFRPWPGIRGRNIARLVHTGFLRANYATQYNVEGATQCGPFMLEAEYTEVYVHRVRDPLGSVNFNGYSVQTRYMLTGEHHEYDVRDGAFGKVNINSPYGAHEICFRYDFVNLTNKDVHGGSQHNVTFGWNWFINQQVRFTFNYIRGDIRPHSARAVFVGRVREVPRHLDMFGLRLQVRFK